MPHKPDIEAIECVNDQEVWVRTPVRNEDGLARFDRLNRDGRRIGAYWLPSRWSQIRVQENRLFAVTYSLEEGILVLAIDFQAGSP
jgi:hypothetical protein